MRTTLDIDEDVLLVAKARAKSDGISIGKALSQMVREAIRTPKRFEYRNGVPLLPHREGARTVTDEDVKRLLEEEGW